jgi:hypothetical protein
MRMLILSFLFQSLIFTGFSQKDTIISYARLVDTVTNKVIDKVYEHGALSVLFQTADSNKTTFSVAFFAPERLPHDIFQINGLYKIYGHKTKDRYVFGSVSKYSEVLIPLVICDSLIMLK